MEAVFGTQFLTTGPECPRSDFAAQVLLPLVQVDGEPAFCQVGRRSNTGYTAADDGRPFRTVRPERQGIVN